MLRLTRPLLAAGIGASLLAGVATLPAFAQNAPIRLAQAGPEGGAATMDVNLFYDQLGRFGTWVAHPDYDYVFIPSDVGPGWRPYQEGRWVWTEQYGWYWESYEPFGWATYHYGRWGYDPAYGWFWVPGDTWAPAWVTWRRGGGRTGWAPIAPDRPGYAVGRPAHYAPPVAESWVFIEDRYMAAEDIAVHVAPIPQINIYLQAAPDIYEPSWDDGYYVNRGFGYRVFDAPVRERLVTREVYYVDNRDDMFFDGNDGGRLGIFAPRLDFRDRRGPPPRYVREIEPDRRPLIRQYVREDRDVPGWLAPSAALLNVLTPDNRRDLRERRFENPDRFRQQVQLLERERADRLLEERRQADGRAEAFQRQQREALEQRRAVYEKLRAQQRAKAQRVVDRVENQPGPRPGGPGVGPGCPGGPAAPGATPGTPNNGPVVAPGTPGGPDAPGTTPPRPGGPNNGPDAGPGRPGGPAAPGATPPRPGGPNNGPDAGPGRPGPAAPGAAPNAPAAPGAVQSPPGAPRPVPGQPPAAARPAPNPAPQNNADRAKRNQEVRERQQQERQQKQDAQQEQQRARQQQNQQQRQQKQDAQQEQQRARQQQNQQQRQQKQEAQQEQQRAKQQQRQEQRQQQMQQRQQKPPQQPGPQQARPPQGQPGPNQPARPPQGQPRPPGGGAGGPGGPGGPGQPPVPPGAQ
jgi:DNA segregation ATPase FtsK/SpoIIIE-like protein